MARRQGFRKKEGPGFLPESGDQALWRRPLLRHLGLRSRYAMRGRRSRIPRDDLLRSGPYSVINLAGFDRSRDARP